jgi:hypothetical protein
MGCEAVQGGGNLPTFQVSIMKTEAAGLHEIWQISFILHGATSNLIAEQLINMIIIYMTLHDMNSQHTSHKTLILFSHC